MNNDSYYDRYAPEADPIGLIALGRRRLTEQIAELNPDEDAKTAADAVYDTALALVAGRVYDALPDGGLRPPASRTDVLAEMEDWLAQGDFDGDETIGDLAEEFVEYWDQQ